MSAPAFDPCPVCGSADSERYCTAYDRVLDRRNVEWEIRHCPACGFGWTYPPLPEDEIGSHYPPTYLGDTVRIIGEFLDGRLAGTRSWRKETEKVRLVERHVPGGRILDVGCADGKFLWALDPGRWERWGVEFSADTVALVRGRIPGLHLLTGDIHHPDLPEGTFDAVTFWHVLEHLPRPREVLARVARLLRPGGHAIISLPNLASLQAAFFRRYWYAFDDVPRHLFHYSPAALERLLAEAGLTVVDHRYFSQFVNVHCLKYSLMNWSRDRFGSRLPYYLGKPLLFLFPLLERLFHRYGILTTIAVKVGAGNSSAMIQTNIEH
jgi:2-polyprenyl-3-methyl-5-hydroxy-6-metoxy-1,4-benzoquinol methylase